MTKTKIISLIRSHKYLFLASLFFVVTGVGIVFVPNITHASPIGNYFVSKLATFTVSTMVSAGIAIVRFGLMALTLSIEVSTKFIQLIVAADSSNVSTSLTFKQLVDNLRNWALSFMGIIVIIIAFVQVIHYKVDEWGAKALLPKLFLASILTLFSTFICSVIYDAGLLVTNSITPPGSEGVIAASTKTLLDSFNITRGLFETSSDLQKNVIAAVIYVVLCLLIAIGYLIISIILFFRTIVILLLMIVAPIAFASMVLPWTNNLFKKWWSEYAKWVFYLPAAYLMLYLSSQIYLIFETALANNNSGVNKVINDMAQGDIAFNAMVFLYKMIIPTLAVFALTVAAIFVPFKMLSKAGNIASSLTKKAGRGAWNATPGGTLQTAIKQRGANVTAKRQTKAGKLLSSTQRRLTGETDEFGKPKSAVRAKFASLTTGRDRLAMGRELDKNTSEVKQVGAKSDQHSEYLARFDAIKATDGTLSDKNIHKKVLTDMLDDHENNGMKGGSKNYAFTQAMASYDPSMARDIAKTSIAKDDSSTARIGAVAELRALNPTVLEGGSEGADKALMDAMTAKFSTISKADASKMSLEHIQEAIGALKGVNGDPTGEQNLRIVLDRAWQGQKGVDTLGYADKDVAREINRIYDIHTPTEGELEPGPSLGRNALERKTPAPGPGPGPAPGPRPGPGGPRFGGTGGYGS